MRFANIQRREVHNRRLFTNSTAVRQDGFGRFLQFVVVMKAQRF